MKHFLFLGLAFLLSAPAHSEDSRFVPHWEASCQLPGHRLNVAFHSASGDATNDDMSVSVSWDEAAASTLPIKPALFIRFAAVSDDKVYCDSISAVRFKSGNILLLLVRDDRPSVNRITAVLLDGRNGRALDVVEDLGDFIGLLTLVRDGESFRVLMNRKWLADQQIGEFPLPDWMLLKDRNNRLEHAWETERK